MEDSKIVDLYLQRNESAISETAQKYGKKIKALAYNICCDWLNAEECENDTYHKTWNSIPPHEPRRYLLAFLLKITRSVAIDKVKFSTRKKRSSSVIELSKEIEDCIPAEVNVEAEIERKLLIESINRFLWKQPLEKRNIFISRYWYMETISTISLKFGLQEGTVKTVLFRLRKDLKKFLKEEGFSI